VPLSVTDDITEEIVEICDQAGNVKEFSREVICDFVKEETTMTNLIDEIEEKLKVKGITVGP